MSEEAETPQFTSLPLHEVRRISEENRLKQSGRLYPDIDRGNANVLALSDEHYVALAGMSTKRQFYAEQLAWRDALINEKKERIKVLEDEAEALRAQINDASTLNANKAWDAVSAEIPKSDAAKKPKPDPKKPLPISESTVSTLPSQDAENANASDTGAPSKPDEAVSTVDTSGTESNAKDAAGNAA